MVFFARFSPGKVIKQNQLTPDRGKSQVAPQFQSAYYHPPIPAQCKPKNTNQSPNVFHGDLVQQALLIKTPQKAAMH
jgi:hypothetical protein